MEKMKNSPEKDQRHFVLVHGAGHGAWCWYKVAALLQSAGHAVTALDLGASGIHPKQVGELRSIMDYVEPLFEFMGALPSGERVVLVGHSMGGAAVAMAMESYVDLSKEDLMLACYLLRPIRLYHDESVLREQTAVTKERYGSVPRVYIVSDQDYAIPEEMQRWMIKENLPDEVKVISGSDHMVMFSKPLDLCSHLQEIAKSYF
ncbi:hypothetical protein CRG98_027977 [Punica granatum]|uniref:AB hydrolase-1 domain-containing protein n=1 Tax=Punica granatum TaxID=22663 RepID=A0A2I0J5U8_PUNGR|nr:hypothetical protein CRG98_027977 [Punica granatum]